MLSNTHLPLAESAKTTETCSEPLLSRHFHSKLWSDSDIATMRERENIFLSAKEARRVFVMEEVVEGRITVREAAAYLNISER